MKRHLVCPSFDRPRGCAAGRLRSRAAHHLVGAQQSAAQQLFQRAGRRLEREKSQDSRAVRVLRDDAVLQKLTAALSTRSAADMFTVIDTLMPSYTTKNTLAPIHPEWLGYKNLDDMKNDYLPGSLDGYMYQGKLYGVPMIAAVFSLYINRKHFQEAGLDPDKDYPRTWDDIGRIGKKLVKMDGNKMTREAFDFAMHSSTWTMWYFNSIIRQYGGEVLDASGKNARRTAKPASMR